MDTWGTTFWSIYHNNITIIITILLKSLHEWWRFNSCVRQIQVLTNLTTFSKGSACSRYQPTTACPASWYATVVFSGSCNIWVFFSRPEGKEDVFTNCTVHVLFRENFIKADNPSSTKQIQLRRCILKLCIKSQQNQIITSNSQQDL